MSVSSLTVPPIVNSVVAPLRPSQVPGDETLWNVLQHAFQVSKKRDWGSATNELAIAFTTMIMENVDTHTQVLVYSLKRYKITFSNAHTNLHDGTHALVTHSRYAFWATYNSFASFLTALDVAKQRELLLQIDKITFTYGGDEQRKKRFLSRPLNAQRMYPLATIKQLVHLGKGSFPLRYCDRYLALAEQVLRDLTSGHAYAKYVYCRVPSCPVRFRHFLGQYVPQSNDVSSESINAIVALFTRGFVVLREAHSRLVSWCLQTGAMVRRGKMKSVRGTDLSRRETLRFKRMFPLHP